MRQPYVGITGFTFAKQVDFILQDVPREEFGFYQLMAGILVSSKTLRGQSNRHPERFPKIGDVHSIIFPDPHVLWLIHFHAEDTRNLDAELGETLLHASPHCHGVQLNVAWPDVFSVDRLWSSLVPTRKQARIVLQIGQKAMDQASNLPAEIARRVCVYASMGIITDVLIDPSGGTGKLFDLDAAMQILLAIDERCPTLNLGIAGGLSAETLHQLDTLVPLFPGLNIDAEGKLRDSQDVLQCGEAATYLRAGLKKLRSK